MHTDRDMHQMKCRPEMGKSKMQHMMHMMHIKHMMHLMHLRYMMHMMHLLHICSEMHWVAFRGIQMHTVAQ
jgi:hypothetical protein